MSAAARYDPLMLMARPQRLDEGEARRLLRVHMQALAACSVRTWAGALREDERAAVHIGAPARARAAKAYWQLVANAVGWEAAAVWLENVLNGTMYAAEALQASVSMKPAFWFSFPLSEGEGAAQRAEEAASLRSKLRVSVSTFVGARCALLRLFDLLFLHNSPPLPLEGPGSELVKAIGHRVAVHDMFTLEDLELVRALENAFFAGGAHEDNALARQDGGKLVIAARKHIEAAIKEFANCGRIYGTALSPFPFLEAQRYLRPFLATISAAERAGSVGVVHEAAPMTLADFLHNYDQALEYVLDDVLLAPLAPLLLRADSEPSGDPYHGSTTFIRLFQPLPGEQSLATIRRDALASAQRLPAQRPPDSIGVEEVKEGVKTVLTWLAAPKRGRDALRVLADRGEGRAGEIALSIGSPRAACADYHLAVFHAERLSAELNAHKRRPAGVYVFLVRHAGGAWWSTHAFWPPHTSTVVTPRQRTNRAGDMVVGVSEVYVPSLPHQQPPSLLGRIGQTLQTSKTARLARVQAAQAAHNLLHATFTMHMDEHELVEDSYYCEPGDAGAVQAAYAAWYATACIRNMPRRARSRACLELVVPGLDSFIRGDFAERFWRRRAPVENAQ